MRTFEQPDRWPAETVRMRSPTRPRHVQRSTLSWIHRYRPRSGQITKILWLVVVLSLASCDGCRERAPDVCCTSDPECAQLGLPSGSVNDYSCGEGHVCRDFYCVAEEGPDASGSDAGADAPRERCNPNAPFPTPAPVANIGSSLSETSFSMTADELTAFITRVNGAETALLVATRASAQADFTAPAPSAELSAISMVPGTEHWPWPTSDALILHYQRQDPTGPVGLFAAYRTTSSEAFTSGSPVLVDGSQVRGLMPQISADGRILYWMDFDELRLYSAQNRGGHDVFGPRSLSSMMQLNYPIVSSDGLTLYYAAGFGVQDVFVSTRSSKDVPFGVGLPLANVNSTENDTPLFITSDGCLLFMQSNRPGGSGGYDIWVARRPQ